MKLFEKSQEVKCRKSLLSLVKKTKKQAHYTGMILRLGLPHWERMELSMKTSKTGYGILIWEDALKWLRHHLGTKTTA